MCDKKEETIIIIGDWFIDENWLVSRQKQYHSSHPGDIHFQARQKELDKRIISLCGSAELLDVLRLYFNKLPDNNYLFTGLGCWNPVDKDILKCILCKDNPENKLLTPFTLKNFPDLKTEENNKKGKSKCHFQEKENCQYHSLELINLVREPEEKEKVLPFSTNRVIRCWEGFGGGEPHLLYRFDWILPVSKGDINDEKLQSIGKDNPIKAIIVEDHGLGVVNDKSIKKLIDLTKDDKPSWFIRTKIINPSWMTILKKYNIQPKLFVVDFHLANYRKGERRWWYGNKLGRAALELLGQMTGVQTFEQAKWKENKEVPESERAAVLLNNNTVFSKEGNFCYGIHTPPGKKQIINIGRTTVFYAALIAQKLYKNKNWSFQEACKNALNCAHKWSVVASESWDVDEKLHFYGDYEKALELLPKVNIDPKEEKEVKYGKKEVKPDDYNMLWDKWIDSSNNLGIVNFSIPSQESEDKLQLWRGEGTLPNYICVGGPKRDAINHLLSVVRSFNDNRSPKHPLSCLLTSSPGWGKSFLASCIAEYFDMEYLEFSVAQMATSRDLIDCLATIGSVQNRTQKKTLVFLDEVNAEIEGNSVMSLLLSPLWDGMFIVDGRSYRLEPGVWIFASTSRIDEIVGFSKGSDFASRLNGPIIDLDFLGAGEPLAKCISMIRKEIIGSVTTDLSSYESLYELPEYKCFKEPFLLRDKEIKKDIDFYYNEKAVDKNSNQKSIKKLRERISERIKNLKNSQNNVEKPEEVDKYIPSLKTEQVYIMVTHLAKVWGPISRVEESVLKLFRDLLPINGIRSLEFFVSSFQEMQGGKVVAENVPIIENNDALRRHIVIPNEWLESKDRSILENPERSIKYIQIETSGVLDSVT